MTAIERTVELAASRDQVFAYVTQPDHFADYVAG